MSMKKRDKITYNVVVIGLMAAVCFATTFFFNIKIPTPAGATMLKIGNIFCLMAGMLFGGWRGGLAAGIGSFIFDLTDPMFVATSPFTLRFVSTDNSAVVSVIPADGPSLGTAPSGA